MEAQSLHVSHADSRAWGSMTTINQLYEIAVNRAERGALDTAERLLMQILEQIPDHVQARHLLAEIALERNQYERAAELLGRVSSVLMDNPAVLVDLSRAYIGTNRPQDAVTCLERAAVLSGSNGRIEQLFAKAHGSLRQFDRAMYHADNAVRIGPRDYRSHEAQADVLLELQQMPRAIECYDRSLALNPDNWQAQANRGVALMFLGRLDDAKNALTFANALCPLQPKVMLTLSMVLIDLGEHDDAGFLLDKLSALAPENPDVLRISGINSLRKGETKAAVRALINALSQDENNLEVQCLLAEALQREGKLENTITVLNQVLDKDVSYLRAYVQKAKAQFLLGRWEEGFATVEVMQYHAKKRFSEPVWDGTDLDGRTILLYAEWGLDELNLLVRLAKYAKQKGGKVLVECTSPVVELVEAMDAVDGCGLVGEKLAGFDCHAPLERLPAIVKLSAQDIGTDPYFAVPSALGDKWRERFGSIDKPKIGIMWRKETDVRPNVYRSVPLCALAPLFEIEQAHFVCLQTSAGLSELGDFPFREKMHFVALENTPMDERLACLSHLDVLITSDTLTGQIASAAGLPVWFLLGQVPDWHYGLEGEKSIWHSTARLFRQAERGGWERVVAQVKEELVNLLRQPSKRLFQTHDFSL